ncbi:MAG TPA: metal-dependent hydrolase [Thermoanaerobaculia bacterium]|nr:metal-dependent hydrolase [Thermoanaerobaculia bacterium]
MFLGHHAVAFAAKPLAPRVSLGTLIAAALLVDLLWPILLILGLEHVRIAPGITAVTPLDFYHYPITHSLLAVLGWSVAMALLVRKHPIVVGATVLSHWVLDFITHRPDLPLWPGGGPKVGLGLWNSVAGTVIVEVAMFVAALFFYLRATRARGRVGSIALWSLVVFVSIIYVANFFSPPPPNVESIGWLGLAQWLFVPWGYWIDRHREAAG